MKLGQVIIFYLGMYAAIGILYFISPLLCGIAGLVFSIWYLWGAKGSDSDQRGEDRNDTGNV